MVTVILVTYNHEPYIRKALDSILEQKTNFKFKIRVLDDCSLDGSVDIIKSYRDRYPSIIEFNESLQNRGAYLNCLRGILNINTKYFATLEGDDYWCDKNKLQKQVNALEMNSDCSFCGHNTIQKSNDGTSFLMFDSRQYDILEKYSLPIKWNKRKYLKIHTSSRLYRYAAIEFDSLLNKENILWDSSSYWYFLSKGSLFFINEAMSVYNYTGKGSYSGANRRDRARMAVNNICNIHAELGYKYYYIFSKLLYKYKVEMKLNLIERFFLKSLPFLSHKKWNMYLSRIK